MKKLISMILVFVMLLSLVSTAVAADTGTLVITAKDTHVVTGNWVTVTLRVEQNPGFQGISFYPVITDAKGKTVNWAWNADADDSAFKFDMNVGTMVLLTADRDCSGTGTLVNVSFFVGENVKTGQYTVSFRLYQNECFNAAGKQIPVAMPTVNIDVMDLVYGDANGDFEVTLLDALLLRRYLANRDLDTGESTIVVEAGADADGDGDVSLKDALLLRQYLATRDLETGKSPVVLGPSIPDDPTTSKQAEYNRYTSTMPGNWSEFTYADANDSQLISYIGASFFAYDYKFENDVKYNPDGSINKDGIVEGAYTVNYDAAVKLEDVTASVDAKWGYTAEQKAEGGYAWKITLRDDLKWDDGTPITVADFEYSMKEMLNPDFQNYRANTYYDTLRIKNAKLYFNQNLEGTYETIGAMGYSSVQQALDAGEILYCNIWNMWGAQGYVDAQGNECPEYVRIDDETVYDTPSAWASGKPYDAICGRELYTYYGVYLEPGTGYDACIFVKNTNRDVAWETVGCYAIPEENAIVICLDNAYDFLKEDGSLSVWAPYNMSSLPLVKQDLYEACKVAPSNGSGLWTSTYNTSLETTASWGPYKLVEFEAGSHYRLEKNEYWYGWNMEEYRNQYNVTAINCQKVSEPSAQWQGFLAGQYDTGALTSDNYADYQDSKYVYYTSTATGTYGMQLFSDLETLRNSNNNNGILAIAEFRQALNLSLDRYDIVEKIWPASTVPCFGLVNTAYYYDIENSPYLEDGGNYRNSTIAKEGILRAYGYVQAKDGTWSVNDVFGMTTEEAYASLTGYNPTLAKEKMQEAINILLANPAYYGYDPVLNITLIYGSSTDNSKQRERAKYLQNIINELTVGTFLENKIEVVFDASAGSRWADAFRSGQTQIGFGYGFSGNAFNPFDIIGAFVNPDDDLNYHMYWDTSKVDMTLTMPAGDYAGAGQTITMSVQNWYYCMNGLAAYENQPYTYDWSAGSAPVEARLIILSALEEITIKESRSIMLIAEGGGSFLSAKFSYISTVENTFMGFGGLRYIQVNYTDEEWTEFIADHNYNLSEVYKQSDDETIPVDPAPVDPKPENPNTPSDSLPPITNPQVGVAYKFGIIQKNTGNTCYISGGIDQERYLSTTTDHSAALDVYIENAEGGIKIATVIDGAKVYIALFLNDAGKLALGYNVEGSVFTFDAERYCWYTYMDGLQYYMGSYNSFETVSASKIAYITAENTGITQFPAGFFPAEGAEPVPPVDPSEPNNQWSAIGSICGTAWNVDFPMTQINEITWESAPLELHAGEEFKVRQGAAWDLNFGVEWQGANIVVETDGTYIIRLVWYGGDNGTVSLIPVN